MHLDFVCNLDTEEAHAHAHLLVRWVSWSSTLRVSTPSISTTANAQTIAVPDRRTQLLRQEWFPATFTRPNTVFTFDCLDTFHELSLQGKGNLYDFYHSLLRKTDNTNISDSIVCFDSLALSLTYKTSSTVSIQRDAQGLSYLAQPHDPQACRARSRPRRNRRDSSRQLDR
jgi:hypothetical protein